MNEIKKTDLERQITLNHEAFQKMPFNERDRGKFAFLRNGELVEIMADRSDARKLGKHLYEDGLYSIQEIMPNHDFGGMSHVFC